MRTRRTVIYASIESDNASSLEARVSACRSWASEHGYSIAGEYYELTSGDTLHQAGSDALFDLVRREAIDMVLVFCLYGQGALRPNNEDMRVIEMIPSSADLSTWPEQGRMTPIPNANWYVQLSAPQKKAFKRLVRSALEGLHDREVGKKAPAPTLAQGVK